MQGCQVDYHTNQLRNVGIFWKGFERKNLVYFTAVLYFYCKLVYFAVISPRFGMKYLEKYGNPCLM
jgi:outer membrane scaffolding protein for murein synthesis (MipA/OmpV family)